jgi:hypothetical protein
MQHDWPREAAGYAKWAVLVTLLVAVPGLLAVRGMGCGNDAGPAPGASAPAPVPPAPPACTGLPAATPPAKSPTHPSRVFTDVSLGMRGFAGWGGKATELRAVHQIINVAAAEAGAPNPRRCSLGARWECAEWAEDGKKQCVRWSASKPVDCDRSVDYGVPSTYAAVKFDTAKIDAVLLRQPLPEKVDPDHPPEPDWLDDAGLTVIVASGLEPGPLPGAETTSAADLCARGGPSPACVARALQERAREGYGVWLVSLLLPFEGAYVADVPVDPTYLERAKAHLKQAKEVAAGESTEYRGIDLSVGPQSPSGRGAAFSQLRYKGVRPLLLIVLSRRPETGRAFVDSVVRKVRADPALLAGSMSPEAAFDSIELAPFSPASYRLTGLELAPKGPAGQGDLDPAALSELRFSPGGASSNGAWAKVSCGAKGKAWTVAPYESKAGAAPLPAWVSQSVSLEGPTSSPALPPKVSLSQRIEGEEAFKVFVSCGPLPVSTTARAIDYALHSRTELDAKALDGSWLARRSAPNGFEMPERIYGLKELAGAVLRQAGTADWCMSRLRLEVTRTE